MKRIAMATAALGLAAAGVLSVPLIVVATAAGLVPVAVSAGPVPGGERPPAAMEALYKAAATRCPGLPWSVLAAIGKVESDHGRNGGRSSAGAEGPMQFLPSTWARYGVDGNADGVASIWDPADAVPAAADYLCANGAATASGLPAAIYQYNHDATYVRTVLAIAAAYDSAASTG